jgi:hypothetical protein
MKMKANFVVDDNGLNGFDFNAYLQGKKSDTQKFYEGISAHDTFQGFIGKFLYKKKQNINTVFTSNNS